MVCYDMWCGMCGVVFVVCGVTWCGVMRLCVCGLFEGSRVPQLTMYNMI